MKSLQPDFSPEWKAKWNEDKTFLLKWVRELYFSLCYWNMLVYGNRAIKCKPNRNKTSDKRNQIDDTPTEHPFNYQHEPLPTFMKRAWYVYICNIQKNPLPSIEEQEQFFKNQLRLYFNQIKLPQFRLIRSTVLALTLAIINRWSEYGIKAIPEQDIFNEYPIFSGVIPFLISLHKPLSQTVVHI